MTSENEGRVLDALSALSQETRLRIVKFLIRAGPEGAAAGAIGAAVDATASRLSFHLTALEHAGLVQSERASRNIIYRACYDQIGGLINYLLVDCCGNHPDVLRCCSLDEGDCCV